MKHLILVIFLVLAMAGITVAGCPEDCDGPFQTCLNICRQTTKEESAEGTKCVKKCEAKDKRSENTTDCTKGYLSAAGDFVAGDTNIVLAANCIEQGLTCVLKGTPCCAPYECKGKFPNTTCK